MSTQPIIDPMVLYKIGLLSKIDKILAITLFILGVAAVIIGVTYFSDVITYGFEDEDSRNVSKIFKRVIAVLILITLLVLAVPSEKTMYSMLATDYLTPANIEYVGDTAEDCIDYIFDKVEELTGAEEVEDE